MDHSTAKMSTLQAIIDAMTQHQLGGLKKKGAAPAVMAVEVKKDDSSPNPLDADKGESGKDEDDESPEMLQKLMEMYGKGDDDEKDSQLK